MALENSFSVMDGYNVEFDKMQLNFVLNLAEPVNDLLC